jgi:hypothetical protein
MCTRWLVGKDNIRSGVNLWLRGDSVSKLQRPRRGVS